MDAVIVTWRSGRSAWLAVALSLMLALAGCGSAPAPVTLPELHLAGHFLLAQPDQGVLLLDLATGARRTLFAAPKNSLVSEARLSPDGATVLLVYAPPPTGGIQFGYTDLYTLPADGSQPPALLVKAPPGDVLYGAAWSPGGKAAIYSHIGANPTGVPNMALEQVAYPGGSPQVALQDGHSPVFSPDGSKMAFILRDSTTYRENLFLAGANGSNPQPLIDGSRFTAVDAPAFSPDGRTVLFSAINSSAQAAPRDGLAGSWLEDWFGVRAASAHNVPSDLWSVPLSGGAPTRLTNLADIGFSASYSPDGQAIAFVTVSGLFVMRPDGSQLRKLAEPGAGGTLEWER